VNSDIFVRTDAPINVNEIGECPKGATTCFTSTDGVKYAQYAGQDVRGGDVRRGFVSKSRENCADECNKHNRCHSADF